MQANQTILLITPEKDLEQFISLVVEGRLPVDVVHLREIDDALSRLDKGMRYTMILLDYDLLSPAGIKLFEQNRDHYKLPLINIFEGDDPSELPDFKEYFRSNKHNRVLLKSRIKEELLSVVTEVYRRFNSQFDVREARFQHNGKSLVRVKTNYFLKLKAVDHDVFLRLPSGKFLKIISAGSEISTETIENVYRKGGEFLYQEEVAYEKLAGIVFESLKQRLNNKNLTNQQKIETQIASIKHVQDTVRAMGISESTIEFTDEIVSSVHDVVKDSKNLAKLVRAMLKMKSTYFVRSSVINYLVGGIIYQAGWDGITTMRKLVYASVFCDFGFDISEEPLIEIYHKDSDAFKRLSKTDQDSILSHPQRAVKYLEKSNSPLTDEYNIVLHHHEKPDGTGFPNGLNYNQIPPLSCAFILCYDFTMEFLRLSRDKDIVDPGEVFEILGPNYAKANFSKPYQALKRALQT